MSHSERSCNVDVAIARLQEELSHLAIDHQITQIGEGEPATYQCILHDKTGQEISVGNGKGRGFQGRASALFEALEHLFISDNSAATFVPISRVASASLAKTERVIQILMSKHPDVEIPCRSFVSVDGSSRIYYPLFLTHPGYRKFPLPGDTFDYYPFSKYATNNGCAIGVTRVEALIHGISEVIERDALSCFLLRTFVAREGAPVRIIDKKTLPHDYRTIVQTIEEMVCSELTLVDITSDLGIPSCLALIQDRRSLLPHVGAGTSLSSGYAIERAALEALQSFHLHTNEMEWESHTLLRRFQGLDRYTECLSLNIQHHKHEVIHFKRLPVYDIPDDLDEYLLLLVSQVKLHGYEPFYAVNYQGRSGITCVHSLVPGLERFHLVRAGMDVLPSDRGMRLVNVPARKTKSMS